MNTLKREQKKTSKGMDWYIVSAMLVIIAASLVTMSSFVSEPGQVSFFSRQIIFVSIGMVCFFGISYMNTSFLRRSSVLLGIFIAGVLLLIGLYFFGSTIKGATSWYQFGLFSFQPSDPIKIITILLLAKYLSRRHIEIHRIKHLLITAVYFFVPFILVFLQPDFGSAVILFAVWFGMILVAGISWKHIGVLLFIGVVTLGGVWVFVFEPYQKARITSFLQPLEDIQGAGYNAYQSTIAVGSGRVAGKGVGYGTQSRLSFLPEHQTDFIFASFAEEWGFVGALIILIAFGVIAMRSLQVSRIGSSNFEVLYGVGVSIYFMTHIIINIGMNIGLLPVTGITLPLMSSGGSHILTECVALGILMSMRRYRSRITPRDQQYAELVIIE
ncbi:MAG: rod shape determining protein RodA [Planctomycetota bacterium]|jgi:rod shape determining protein RodA